jgi:hypothetical protein
MRGGVAGIPGSVHCDEEAPPDCDCARGRLPKAARRATDDSGNENTAQRVNPC